MPDHTFLDLVAAIIRRAFFTYQRYYNFYVKKYHLIDKLKGTEVTIILLVGKYPSLWDVVFRRLYKYSGNLDVIVVNAGCFSREKAIRLSTDYGFSYFECIPNNYISAQNFVIKNVVSSRFIIKVDDDVFLTRHTIKNMIEAYKKLVDDGYDVGFVAPVLNVNNVSYYHFLKTLDLLEEYERLFGKPLFTKHWTKQPVWYDPRVAEWIWEKSLPLNSVSDIFNSKNRGLVELIPVRFSIQCIMFEREFVTNRCGYLSILRIRKSRSTKPSDIKKPNLLLPFGDEDSINYYSDTLMYGRFLVLDAFAGHLSYYPQTEYMLKWFEKNKVRFIDDL